MTDEELTKLLSGKANYNVLIPALIEANLKRFLEQAKISFVTAIPKQKLIQERKV